MSADFEKLTWEMPEPFKHIAVSAIVNGEFWMVWRPEHQWYACLWNVENHEFEVEKRDDGTWRPFENLHDAKQWCYYREIERWKELHS